MQTQELLSIAASREVRLHLGRQFVGVQGFWSTAEMRAAHERGAVGVPCAEYVPAEGRYRYYIRRKVAA